MAATFKVQKTRDFTIMSNYHLRDSNISLKAKGLLSLIFSLPDDWDYSERGLSTINKEGVTAISSAIDELETAGYIFRRTIRAANGRFEDVEYTVYEQPKQKMDGDDTPVPSPMQKKVKMPVGDVPVSDSPMTALPKSGFPFPAEPVQENRDQINIDIINTNKQNTDITNHSSINQAASETSLVKAGGMNEERLNEEYNKIISEIKLRIDYDSLIISGDKRILDDAVEIIADVMLSPDSTTYSIGGERLSAALVKMRLTRLDSEKMEVFMLTFSRIDYKIKSMRNYIISTLYNLSITSETALTNMVNADMRERSIKNGQCYSIV